MTKDAGLTRNVVREAQTQENYDASAKQKAAAKLSRIPIKVASHDTRNIFLGGVIDQA